jgi:excinuclease ABC subunit C
LVDEVLSAVIARLPLTPGVYRFRDATGRVLYIGRATVLRRRVASYWSDLRDRRHLTPMVARVRRVEAVACDSVHEAAWLERNLLTTSLPPWNRTPGGQEIPVYIRLDPQPARPSLSVAHVARQAGTAVYFGPYLGGRRVRQAVKGLGRIAPLAYTGTGLRGTRLDIARARGFAGADRASCVATISAVLRRQPDAVTDARTRLTELRDRAASALAFELAGDIDAELRALAWVTSPQRATSMIAADFTASGWSGGVLTSFVARHGQVCEWVQSECPRSDAAARLAGTPPDWADFAQRNAELARQLGEPQQSLREAAERPAAVVGDHVGEGRGGIERRPAVFGGVEVGVGAVQVADDALAVAQAFVRP